MRERISRWLVISALVAFGTVGCGGDGIVRHQVQGKVTFQGQAVQDGAMVFEPDASVGKIAPTSFARIENGSYQTARSESPTTGKYKVRVMGYDKSKMKKDAAVGEIIDLPELFPEYAIEAEIPPPGGTLDIEVPTFAVGDEDAMTEFVFGRKMAMIHRWMALDLALYAAWVALGGQSPPYCAAETVFPGREWQEKTPAELGLDAERLEAVAVALGGRGCVVKDGFVVKVWGDQAEKGDWLSSAKPVLSTLLMFAVQEGKVKSVDTPIVELGWPLEGKDRGITFRHLANMTSGYARPEGPGEAWAYNDYAIQLYQQSLFDRVFKQEPDAAANAAERLGGLGLQDGLSFTPDKRRLKASARDFARIGWFWLNRGKWGEKQLLPARYFDEFMQPQVPKDLPVSRSAATDDYLKIGTFGGGSEHFTRFGAGIYGFNWWFNETGREHLTERTWPDAPADAVMSIGAGGNNSVMMPRLGLVAVCARGAWGKLEAGQRESVLNQQLKLIAEAGAGNR